MSALAPALALKDAWQWRERLGLIRELGSLRVFHGPGESPRSPALKNIAIDRFCDHETGAAHFWLTEWADSGKSWAAVELDEIRDFLASLGAASAVALLRPEKGVPSQPRVFLGEPPSAPLIAREGDALFKIKLEEIKHPGLFLDHYPLRRWLKARSRGLAVLNTFGYTGSLSVAAGLGGAAQVTTLDLSSATVAWAKENWELNRLNPEEARFIAGDYFDWLPRLKREGKRFDLVILDPPSFSRGKAGTFSTAKDLRRLHAAAFAVLKPEAFLVTSINSANVRWSDYEQDVLAAAEAETGVRAGILSRIDLPDTFPTPLGEDRERYLKGWILRISSGSGASNRKRS